MIKGFRDFILRGNVVDLAVGVVMGAAFGAVVTAFTKSFLDPLIKLVTGGAEVGGKIVLADGVALDYGAFITALITFILTALVIYLFVVTPMNKAMENLKKEEKKAPPAPSKEEVLLTEIRDLLKKQ